MQSTILSLNSGHPERMEWQGKAVVSSMRRQPVSGPLVVHKTYIEGSSFGAPAIHGIEHSVLYAYGLKSALQFMARLGHSTYDPGALGENVTLDDLNEEQISVGDIFAFGEVRAQAVYPRIPCSKVNFRMQNPEAQKHLVDCGRSGIYFRILKPGKIFGTDKVSLVESAQHRMTIFELYQKMTKNNPLTDEEVKLALKNGAFPQKMIEKWQSRA